MKGPLATIFNVMNLSPVGSCMGPIGGFWGFPRRVGREKAQRNNTLVGSNASYDYRL